MLPSICTSTCGKPTFPSSKTIRSLRAPLLRRKPSLESGDARHYDFPMQSACIHSISVILIVFPSFIFGATRALLLFPSENPEGTDTTYDGYSTCQRTFQAEFAIEKNSSYHFYSVEKQKRNTTSGSARPAKRKASTPYLQRTYIITPSLHLDHLSPPSPFAPIRQSNLSYPSNQHHLASHRKKSRAHTRNRRKAESQTYVSTHLTFLSQPLTKSTSAQKKRANFSQIGFLLILPLTSIFEGGKDVVVRPSTRSTAPFPVDSATLCDVYAEMGEK
ncbi:hypothetical protein B0J14DRAFT_138931 [Halenospora varia]|nr:hypothetical protein B0J14DRAFT_138931 [Halenospora varia]